MIKRDIEKHLSNVMHDIEDMITEAGGAPEKFLENMIIAGGAITSLIHDEEPKDYDIYFLNLKDAESLLPNLIYDVDKTLGFIFTPIPEMGDKVGRLNIQTDPYAHIFDSKQSDEYYGKKIVTKGDTSKLVISSNAVTINKYQFITRRCGPVEYILKHFDLMHCINYYSLREGLVLNPRAMQSTALRELVVLNPMLPLDTLRRVIKFCSRGWNISTSELMKLVWEISQMDLSDPDILKDKLPVLEDYPNFLPPLKTTLNKKDFEEIITKIYG